MKAAQGKQAATNGKVKVIHGARLIDGNGGPVLKNPVVVLDGKRIKAIGSRGQMKEPKGAEVVNAGKYTLMPGMFDVHMHLAAMNYLTFSNYRAAVFEVTPQLQSFYMLFHAQMCFEMGFTTLRDLGKTTPHGDFYKFACGVRNAINANVMTGPRLFVCGRPIITGAHIDLSMPRQSIRAPNTTADGPWELRRMARESIRAGVDWIKTSTSGGGGNAEEEPDIRNMTQEELDAIVDEAHAFHKHVAVHCFTSDAHRMCLKAGVDTIEHIVFTDDETIKMIRESGTPVVPTLLHRTDHAIEIRRRMGTPMNVLTKMKRIQPYAYESFKRMHQAGIKLALGTDTGLDPEMATTANELEIYVKLGMTPMEALQTATKNAAQAIKVDKDLGTLEPGKLADIIAVDGDPSKDITVLQKKDNIRMVMKEGHAYIDKIAATPKYVIHPDPGSWKIIDAL